MRRFTLLTVVLSSAVTFLIGILIAGGLTPGPTVASAPRRPATVGVANDPGKRTASRAGGGVVNFADVAERINPAVVNIDATSKTGNHFMISRSAPGNTALTCTTTGKAGCPSTGKWDGS